MSQPSRSKARIPARRKRQAAVIQSVEWLEDRQVLTPVVATSVPVATFTAATTPTNDFLGTVNITTVNTNFSAAATTSVAELTSLNSFGGDMVRIEAGPGGVFGKAVYAISRGAGANADPTFRDSSLQTPINRPGVIYRVDPATGQSSVFFDLNTVINQLDPNASPGNGASPDTGLTNWYDIAFDPNGYFDGKPSMFVSSIDTTDSFKNVVYRIAPDGTFMGLYFTFNAIESGVLKVEPSAILVPPTEQQSFLRGMFVGQNSPSTNSINGPVLFIDANSYVPGTNIDGTNQKGVVQTPMFYGPQVALTAANSVYASPDYAVFTNFGTPAGGGIPANPGLSGIEGLQGGLLISSSSTANNTTTRTQRVVGYPVAPTDVPAVVTAPTATASSGVDQTSAIATPFRRFQDAAFDQYGYFSYGTGITAGTGGGFPTATTIPPVYAGSMFVTDLATGLAISVTPVAPLPTNNPVAVPIQGPGIISLEQRSDGSIVPVMTNGNTTQGSNLGGRVIRIGPDGGTTPFAEGFHTSGAQDATAFSDSTLSISFSADGTTLYVADMDGIWQFKTTTSLAGSTSGSLVGLNDLRSLGVPYDGANLAAGVVDTGVDARSPLFRGRVAPGKNVVTGGLANDDLAGSPVGHGTEIAGVISQFVPQSTIVPVSVFTALQVSGAPTIGGTTSQYIWNGLQYLNKNPYVNNPVQPNSVDRLVTANFGFGTDSTFQTEVAAYKSQKQAVLSLKAQMQRLRKLGIQPIAAAGQLSSSINSNTNNNTAASLGDTNWQSMPAVLNEVISVSGVYPFPFTTGATSPPTDPVSGSGVIGRIALPALLTNGATSGSTAGSINVGNLAAITPDLLIFEDKIMNAANRGPTTDFVAPALDIPTFARTGVLAASGGTNTTPAGTTLNIGGTGLLTFQQGGTSLASAMVTGAYTMVNSALDYWTALAHSGGVTSDAYLNVPVGTKTLNFGATGIADLSSYINPDSIYAILEWTAVPATDAPNTLETINPSQLFPNAGGPYANYARIDVGNAIAAIEGTIALNYLFQHGDFDIIDSNHNGLVTANELQTFEDNSAANGLAEAGAMARLLGGTARIPTTGYGPIVVDDTNPEQPDVLQRRYNFFDYAADGQLNGAISIQQYQMLAKTLLPSPDAFKVTNRVASSANGWLLDPNKDRNFVFNQQLLLSQQTVPNNLVRRFAGLSPQRFGVNRGVPLILGNSNGTTNNTNTGSYNDFTYTLFEGQDALSNGTTKSTSHVSQSSGTGTTGGTSTGSTTGGTSTGSTTGGTSTGSTTGTGTASQGTTSNSSGGSTTTGTKSTTSQSGYSQQVLQALQNLASGTSAASEATGVLPSTDGTQAPAASDTTSSTSDTTSTTTDTTSAATTPASTPVSTDSATVSTTAATAPTPAEVAQQEAKQAAQARYEKVQTLQQERAAKQQAAIQASYDAQASGKQPAQSKTFVQKLFGSNGLFGWKG